ncbi:MAG: hypothetical protein MUC83_12305 [Pirellula sp.]|jgi:hypothetical protein|nr:hypothetical protein [Pirellula sp.]
MFSRSDQFNRPKCAWFLTIYCTVIAAVSLYDIYLTKLYAISLPQMEQNPIARIMMNLDEINDLHVIDVEPDVRGFLALKGLGTFTVVLVIVVMVFRRPKLGHPVGFGLTLIQLALLGYFFF